MPGGTPLTLILAAIAIAVLVVWWILHRRRNRRRSLDSVLNDIAFERLEGLIIPKADEGEIQIDHLVLTAQGLLIIDIKDMEALRVIAIASSILLIAVAVLIVRWGHVKLPYPSSRQTERDTE